MSDARALLEREVGGEHVTTLAGELCGRPLPLASPASEEQLVELLRIAQREQLRVVPVGFASKLGWCRPPEHADFALSTRRIVGVVDHDPGDGTLTARAGSTMAALANEMRATGHHLTPEVAQPGRATLGGVVAAGQSGLDRTRLGPLREHLLGVRVALADGSITKSGGRLVKNVTGFDLHRLYCGSHGTLCVVLEATLRLSPAPELEIALCAPFAGAREALARASTIRAAGTIKAHALVVENITDAGTCRLHVLLAGRSELVEWQCRALTDELEDASVLRAADARARFELLRDLEQHERAWPDVRVQCLPSRLERALAAIEHTAHEQRVEPRWSIQPAVATIDVRLKSALGAAQAASIVLARTLRTAGVQALLRNASVETRRAIEPCGEPGAGLELMRRLKKALDPDSIFASDRFHAGL